MLHKPRCNCTSGTHQHQHRNRPDSRTQHHESHRCLGTSMSRESCLADSRHQKVVVSYPNKTSEEGSEGLEWGNPSRLGYGNYDSPRWLHKRSIRKNSLKQKGNHGMISVAPLKQSPIPTGLTNFLRGTRRVQLGTIQLHSGAYSSRKEEALDCMLQMHYPGFTAPLIFGTTTGGSTVSPHYRENSDGREDQ